MGITSYADLFGHTLSKLWKKLLRVWRLAKVGHAIWEQMSHKVGHNYTGNNHIGHNYVDHNYVGHNYIDHKHMRYGSR